MCFSGLAERLREKIPGNSLGTLPISVVLEIPNEKYFNLGEKCMGSISSSAKHEVGS